MGRILLSVALGLFTLVVFIGVGESFQGKAVAAETLAGGFAVALYLALAQFLVAPRANERPRGKWPTVVAMGVPVVAICLVVVGAEGGRAWLHSALPMLIPGCFGIAVGAVLAGRVKFSTISLGVCRRFLLVGAALLAAVALVVGAAVIPLTHAAGTFPDGTPGRSVPVFWGLAVLNVLVAAALALRGVRAGSGHRPPPVALAALAFLAFVSACILAVPAFAFRGHGPVLLIVSRLALLGLAAEIAVTALVGVTALRLPEEETG